MRKLSLIGLICLVVSVWLTAVAWSETLAQERPPDRPNPPPDLPGGPPGRTTPPQGGGGSGGGKGEGGSAYSDCSSVYGVAINWGYQNEPRLPVDLSGSSWQTQLWTDDNGSYGSGCLGMGIALVNPVSPPWLQPMTKDVAIRTGFQPALELNLGLYSGNIAPRPEVIPAMTASSDRVQPGETITYTLQVTNTLGNFSGHRPLMGNVMLTDLLPESLTPVIASSTAGTVEWWGNLLTASVGELSPDQTVTVVIIAKVRDDVAPASLITNQASLLHHDHVAVQTAPVEVEVGLN